MTVTWIIKISEKQSVRQRASNNQTLYCNNNSSSDITQFKYSEQINSVRLFQIKTVGGIIHMCLNFNNDYVFQINCTKESDKNNYNVIAH